MIELCGIHRDFQVGDQIVRALDDINLTIEQGEYLSVMGPSGSGKSTLLNLIGMLDHATAGSYRLDGVNITDLAENDVARIRNRQIGFVFQSFHLIPRLSAAGNIELPLILAGMPPAERVPRVDAAIAAMKLETRRHHKPDQLSGGQRQRVAIARATVNSPSVLLADEPTGNLDSRSGKDVVDTLEALNDSGITLIVVTHDASLGDRAHRHLKMVDGQIVEDRRSA